MGAMSAFTTGNYHCKPLMNKHHKTYSNHRVDPYYVKLHCMF